MTIVKPVDFKILENTFDKDKAPIWSKEQEYIEYGFKVQHENIIYQNATEEDKHLEPNKYTSKWVMVGSINELAFDDNYLYTQSISSGEVVLKIFVSSAIDSLCFLNLSATAIKIECGNFLHEQKLYTKEQTTNWWDYFFKDFAFKNDVFLMDNFLIGEIKITIYPNEEGVKLGKLIVGLKQYAGETLYSPSISVVDYSKKVVDEWGNTTMKEGFKAKYMDTTCVLYNTDTNEINKLFTQIHGKACLFIADERKNGFEALTIYGAIENYKLTIPNFTKSEYTLSVKGLI